MKAAIYTSYGPPEVLRVQDIEKPVISREDVLIKIFAATVNRTDCGYRSAQYVVSRLFTGLLKPKRPVAGSEFAGEIVEVGKDVSDFKVGDGVFGFDDVNGSAHAEYMKIRQSGPLAKMPKQKDFYTMAAAGEGATYAYNVIQAKGISKGQKVMVYGATGAIGSAAVQILKYKGVQVTAVCGTKHTKLVKSLGADRVVDYETNDFTKDDERYDLVFDAVGKSSYGACKKLLNKNGAYYSTELGFLGQNIFLALWFAVIGSKKVIFPIPKINKEIIEAIATMVEKDKFTPLIDRQYELDQIVEAAKYVETGQKIGNVVIRVR